MASTTLITFLVRTPPATKSVSLLGSWDNFTKAYPMRRDARLGPEHWSGCHRFTNIVCDGGFQPNGVPRDGGLKMGGTYWYYYQLDDDIEFHNSAEPSTTSCPMLPGQLVNVLHVPLALSGNRSRNASVSSVSSELRTMNPADKFMNPRPVPKPSLPRLKTSPTLSTPRSQSSSSRPSSGSATSGRRIYSARGRSQPGSAETLRRRRIGKKTSFDDHRGLAVSAESNRTVAIISAFRSLRSPQSENPIVGTDRRAHTEQKRALMNDKRVNGEANAKSKHTTHNRPLPSVEPSESTPDSARRTPSNKASETQVFPPVSSFEQHRRQRSRSRTPSSLRNLQTLDDDKGKLRIAETVALQPQPLETVKEVPSVHSTPTWPPSATKIVKGTSGQAKTETADLQKRLPTLPNTPSSAYPPSSGSPRRPFSIEMDILQSHFSSTTIETDCSRSTFSVHERSHFSDWTCPTDTLSPSSDNSTSIIDDDPMSPFPAGGFVTINSIQTEDIPAHQERAKGGGHTHLALAKEGTLTPIVSCSTISSAAPSTAPSSYVDMDSPTRSESGWNKFQHYTLPSEELGSEATPKPHPIDKVTTPLVVDERHPAPTFPPGVPGYGQVSIPHSSGMQQLLSELSYLSDMIQQR